MARKKATSTQEGDRKCPIETYEHKDKRRVNNPPVGLVTPETDPESGEKKKPYAYDPHLDPQLQWAGKAEHTSFEVPTVSLHVHERIDPRTIIEAARRAPDPATITQLSLFQTVAENPPLREAIEFYKHAHGWSNRFIAGKPCERTKKSHINVCVYDSTWEASDAFALDESDAVEAWVKNDHLGFEVLYVYRGVVRKYRPDFLIRLVSGDTLILETKGQDTEQDQVKRRYLDEWVQAVNTQGGFGRWRWATAYQPGQIKDILLAARDVGAGQK